MHSFGSSLRAAALISVVAGCNYLLDLETSQCAQASECEALGPEFRGALCIAGSCKRSGESEAGTGGGSSSTAGTGGSAVGAEAGAGNGEGGSDGEPGDGCVSTEQCIADHLDEPYACLTPGEPCVPLKSEACPLVFGDYADENAIYVGAFMNVPASAPLSQMSTLNVELAIDEFNGSVGGLPGGPLGKLRPLVAVVCRNDANLLEAGAAHLIENVRVPAVIAHLSSATIKEFFVDHALPAEVFVMNPGFADNSLTSLSSEGLFWHVIGDIRDVSPAYAPLLARIETHIASPEPIRVATIVSQRFAEQSIADSLTPLLSFNGKSVIANGADFYTAAVPALADEPDADYSSVNQALLAFKPHVVLAITREEFVYKILPAVEGGWAAAAPDQARPFYVVPTSLSGNTDLLNFVAATTPGNTSENKRQRMLGVAPASAEDLTLYNQFLVRFRTAYPRFESPGGFENFYDAVYLLGNAMFAAGSVAELTGPDIARGMQRVITGGTSINVGPTFIADGFTALAAGGSIRLNGTMGPADFDPGIGARRGSGSVYCIQREGSSLSFAYDVLRVSAEGELQGSMPCIPGL